MSISVRTIKQLEVGAFKVIITVSDPSAVDDEKFAKFGVPNIDLGGDFEEGELSFSLPAFIVPVWNRAGQNFVQRFDLADYDDAEDRADLWAETIEARILSAMTTLRANTDTFSSVTQTTI